MSLFQIIGIKKKYIKYVSCSWETNKLVSRTDIYIILCNGIYYRTVDKLLVWEFKVSQNKNKIFWGVYMTSLLSWYTQNLESVLYM